MTILVYAAIVALMIFLVADIITYAPGERQRLDQERRPGDRVGRAAAAG